MSIMTDIRDRLMASGDTEAAHALDHACFAARDRLDALDEMRKDLAAKEATIAEQAERIAALELEAKNLRSENEDLMIEADKHVEEITHLRNELDATQAWPCDGEGDERGNFVCKKDARISELEATVAEAAEVLEPFVAWKDQMENHPHVLSTKCTFDDDDLPFTVTPEWRHLRRAAALREKIMDLCHASPVPGCETSSPRSEAPQSTDGENTQ